MKRPLAAVCLCMLAIFLAGCLTAPVERSGGPGSITVPNTTADAVVAAARTAFARHGYTPGPGRFPNPLIFDRPAGSFGHLMFGSYGRTTTFRVRLQMIPVPGTNDFRLIPTASRVSNARMAGFESEVGMTGFWASQFRPIMRAIRAEAANARSGT